MKQFAVFVILLLQALVCCATDKPYLDYLGIEHGLSNNAVTSIYQDRYGFMWFGTYDGLNRYDGYKFKIFKNRLNDTTSLANNRILSIYEGPDNNLWVGTAQGVSIYNRLNGKFLSVYYKTGEGSLMKLLSSVNDFASNRAQDMFIGTGGSGVLLLQKNAESARQLAFVGKEGKPVYNYHVQDIHVDKKDQVWLFIQGRGLGKFNPRTGDIRLVSDLIQDARCITADYNENIWIGNVLGLYRYNLKSRKIQEFHEGDGTLSNSFIHKLSLDSKGNIWAGTDGGGINIIDARTFKFSYILPGQEDGTLKSGAVDVVFEDSNKRIWIGTLRGGISILDNRKNVFNTIRNIPFKKTSLSNNFILSFCEDKVGNVWIGTDGYGVDHWDRATNTFRNYKHIFGNPASLTNNNVSNVIHDKQGQIWIATYGGGINKYNPSSNSFTAYNCYNSAYHYVDRYVWGFYQDKAGNLWAGTCNDGGLYRLNRQSNAFELFDPSLRNVISLNEDRQGNFWAGTFGELILIDRTGKKHKRFPSVKAVRAIHEDRKGRLWIGTEGGGLLLFNRDKGTFSSISEKDGLPGNAVLTILEDRSGKLWMSTFSGLALFNPDIRKFSNFYESDGLQSNQFNYNAALALSTGEFLFGGIKGFNIFRPEDIQVSNTIPKIRLTSLKIDNIPYEADSTIEDKQSLEELERLELPYDKAIVSVEFAALDFSGADRISYFYTLEGWDKKWSNAGTSRVASYSRLREGTYYLKIKSTNAGGNLVANEKVIKLVVLPPWWRAWWAYLLYAAGIFYTIYRYNVYQRDQERLKYEVRLSRVTVEKEKELNEKKLSFFTHISHEFRTPLTLIISPIQDYLNSRNSQVDPKDLIVVYRNARRLLSLVDQLLHFRKSDADKLRVSRFNLVLFCKEVYLCFIQQAKLRNIIFDFQVDNEELEIFADKEKIEILLFNLISNAFKYTPQGGTIKFSLIENQNSVELRVKDNGPGVDEKIGDKLFDNFFQVNDKDSSNKAGFGIGLFLVKKIVESHSGKVGYTSKKGEGAEFKIELLKGSKHFDSAVIHESIGEIPVFLDELLEKDETVPAAKINKERPSMEVVSEKRSLLVVDDNDEIRNYVVRIFQGTYNIYEADSAENALVIINKNLPDIVITDVVMGGISGVELCAKIKDDPALSYIPVILLTSSSSAEIKLRGIEGGADDYITKPFDKDILIARVTNLLKSRNNIQKYFYNQITLKSDDYKISQELKEFLDKCIKITEKHLQNPDFNVKILADEIGISHSTLYKKVKSISGKSVNEFIRFIRLRKAAELFINTDCNVNEGAFEAGFNDIKYFREQFNKLFEMRPSEYIKKYRKTFNKGYKLNEKVSKG
jgi:signal transduction histidine kinase/ligand-binding sensor domain-containing protein/DNA-binding response OmpR family regulator